MELKETVEIIEKMMANTKFSESEREALKCLLSVTNRLSKKNETEVDFQGWELKKHKVRDLKDILSIRKDLDEYELMILEDDGMGYGAVNGYCNGIEIDDNNKELHLWF